MTKERKYILFIGTILVLAALIYRYFPTGFGLYDKDQEIILKQKKIVKYTQVIQQKRDIEKYLNYLNKVASNSEKLFLSGATPSLGAVEIQNILIRIAREVGVEIKRIEVEKEKKNEENSIIGVPVKCSIRSTTRKLRDLIFHIESSDKLLRIIRVKSNAQSRKFPEQIDSSITIEGFIRE